MSIQHVKIAFGLCAAQDGCCFYCGVRFTGPIRDKRGLPTNWTRDHLKPASDGNGHARNIVLACLRCNHEKGNKPATQDQMERAARIHAKALNIELAFAGSNSWWGA